MKFNSNWYSIDIIKRINGVLQYAKDENGYLFSNAKYKTKIKPSDLPEWYIFGRYYKRWGYLNAKGVIDLRYIPNKCFNHFLKDDNLFISYGPKIDKKASVIDLLWQKGIHCADGGDIISMLKAIKKYSNYDISPIIEQLNDKLKWFKENYPEDFDRFHYTDNFINDTFKE